MEYQLEDFFEYYPAQDDPEIQRKIANYHEFQQCASGRQDVKIPGDTFYSQQRAYQRLGYVFDRLAVVAEAGVGKTRFNICLAQYLKDTKQARKNYFITGRSQIDDYKRQLIETLSGSPEIAEKLRTRKGTTAGQTKKLDSVITDFYKVMTYDAFVKKVLALVTKILEERSTEGTEKLMTDQSDEGSAVFARRSTNALATESNRRIAEKFAGCSLFFDEIQFVKITSSNIAKKEGDARKRHIIYWTIWRVCQVVTKAKVTIASARPLTNEPKEFAYAMNWILPLDQQIPLDKVFQAEGALNAGLTVKYGVPINWRSVPKDSTSKNLEKVTDYYMEAMEPYLRGRVMFVAAADTGVLPSYLPLSEPLASKETQLQIETSRESQLQRMESATTLKEKAQANLRLLPMKLKEDGSFDIQAQTYADYLNKQKSKSKNKRKEFEDKNPREIMTAVFPKIRGQESAQNWGIEAMNRWVTTNYTYREGVVSAENGKGLRWYLANHLDSISISMAYIRNVAVNFPWKGYVFSDIVRGGGVNLLGLAFEEGGRVFIKNKWYNKPFERYSPQEFNAETVPPGQLKRFINKGPRYAVISTDSVSRSPTAMTKILSLYNHPDNIHGEYLKYIFISKKGMTGINLMHVMHVFSLFISHNPSDLYQAIRRAIRANSHQELYKLWMSSKLYRDYPFEISINLLTPIFGGGEYATIAMSIFARTLNKDLNIAPVMRTYKQLSVTARIFEKRNNLNAEQAGTADADYMSNVLSIPGELPDEIIYSNYLLLYSGEQIASNAREIIATLRRDNEYDIRKHITAYNGDLQLSIFYLAIASLLVSNEYDITDKFGFKCDAALFDSILYLNRRYSSVPQRELCSYYTSSLITIESKSLLEIIDETVHAKIGSVYVDVLEIGNDVDALTEYISAMKIEQKALFLESIIAEPNMSVEYESILNTILELFDIDLDHPEKPGNYFAMDEPIERIQRISEQDVDLEDRSVVYVHNIYVYVKGSSGAGKISRTVGAVGRLRIFRVSEGKWRDTREDETQVYQQIFVDLNLERERRIQQKSKIYGRVVEGDTKFWIIDKYMENRFAGGNEIREGTATQSRRIHVVAYMWGFGYRYDIRSLRDQHPELFINMHFQLKPDDLEKSDAYDKSLNEQERANLELMASIKSVDEINLIRDTERKYSKTYPKRVIVHAVREKMILYAIERARKRLWNEVDRRIGQRIKQTFSIHGVTYTFGPAVEGIALAADAYMVAFFYHYLSSQSATHGYPKNRLIKLVALKMYELGLVISDTLPQPTVLRIIENL